MERPQKLRPRERRRKPAAAFTLIELVIAITILGILAGLAVPAIDGIQKERQAREPVNQLLLMARTVRNRALAEQRPYQIGFDGTGFYAARFFTPYGGKEEFDQLKMELHNRAEQRKIIEASQARGIQLEEIEVDPRQEILQQGLEFQMEYKLPEDLDYRIRLWGEVDWSEMTAGEFRRWVFQPSGMCQPMIFQVQAENSFFEVEFHPLTADVKSERSWVE